MVAVPEKKRRKAMREDNQTTPEEAKAIWDEMENPTLERVCERLVSAGKKATIGLLGYWQKENWFQPTPEDVSDAMQKLDAKVPLITGNPRNGTKALLPEDRVRARPFGKELAVLGDDKLVRNVNREALITCGILFREVQSKRRTLLQDPVSFGSFLTALGNVLEKVMTCSDRATTIAERLVRADEMSQRMTIDVTPGIDPVADVMRSFVDKNTPPTPPPY